MQQSKQTASRAEPRQLQQSSEQRLESQPDQITLSSQRDAFGLISDRAGEASATVHATRLSRSSLSQNSQFLLRLQRQYGNRYVQRVVQRSQQSTASPEQAAFLEAGWSEINELGIVYQETGANLRDKPLPEAQGSRVIERLTQNTKVFILKHDKTHHWYAVAAVGEQGGGKFGYVYDQLIWRKLPEPNVKIYKIKSGDYPLGIAAQEQGYLREFDVWGEDLRYVVNALVYVNTNAQHNGTGESGLRKIDNDVTESWFTAKAQKDVYIWLPSSTFLKAMYREVVEKGGGTGSITADLWESVKRGLKKLAYGAAFVGGLIHGFAKSIYDAVVGIAEMLIDVLVSIFTGNVLQDAKELWDAVSNLTWDDIENAVGDWALEWGRKLESDNPFTAGHAHGYLTGYVMGEAAMLLATGGTTAAAKSALWTSRFGKAIKATKAFQRFEQGVGALQKTGKAKEALESLKATGKIEDAAELRKLTAIEHAIQIGDVAHTLKIKQIGKTIQILLCTECSSILEKIDAVLPAIPSKGPTKSLHARLTKLRQQSLDLEVRINKGEVPFREIPGEVNQIAAHLKDLSKKYPDFKFPLSFRAVLDYESLAKRLGFNRTNHRSHGQAVYEKGGLFITPDVDSHIGGVWKMADSPRNLGSKKTRMGTYDEHLKRIGD